MAVAGDTASAEFKEIAGQVGKMKKVIVDTDLTLDGMSQNLSQNVGGALQGVASGFELAQGAMGSFGAGGEAVEEALLKVQSAMAMAQGLQGIRESIASFGALRKMVMSNVIVQKLLNFVMNLNPIGMIILAVAALGAAIALLWSPIKKLAQLFGLVAEETETAAEANKKLTAEIERQAKAVDDLAKKHSKMHDNRMREMAIRGASEEELHQAELDNLAKVEADRTGALLAGKGRINKLTKLYKQAKREEDDETARSVKEQIKAEKEKIKELKLGHEDYNLARQESDKAYLEETAKAEEDALKERQDRYKTFLENRQAAERRIEDLKLGLIEDDLEREAKTLRIKAEREIEDIKATGEAKIEIAKLIEETLQKDLLKIQQDFVSPKLEIKKLELDNHKKLNREIIANDKLTIAEQIQLDKDVRDSKVQIAKDGFQLVADLAGLFANRSEKAARVAFNIQKVASIAQATMDGYKAVLSTYAQTPGGPVIKGIAAGISGAFAGIQIAKIASAKFGGGAPSGSIGGGGGGGAPNTGGGSNVANFNVVGNSGVNQLAESLGNNETVVKSYVVAGDVTSTQSLDRNKIDTATI
jgi:hypothetical protein